MAAPSRGQVPDSLGGAVSHTPGPYEIHWNMGSGEYHRIVRADDPDVGWVGLVSACAPTDGDMEAEARANAFLWNAAPDLLEALEPIVSGFNAETPETLVGYITREQFLAAIAAVRKARGAQS